MRTILAALAITTIFAAVVLLAVLRAECGGQVTGRGRGSRVMAGGRCAAAGVIPSTTFRAWQLAAAGWIRRLVPFGPIRRPLPPGSVPGHPESMTAALPAEQERA